MVVLPSGGSLPLTADLGASVAGLKQALQQQCGWPAEQLPSLGIALGHAALDEARSLQGNDVCPGDTLCVFVRTG